MSMFSMELMKLRELSLHPPALDAGEEEEQEIPWVLLEEQAYVADQRNATTAYSDCGCNGMIQAILCVSRPPRLSYICVFYLRPPVAAGEEPTTEEVKEEQKQMVPTEPEVIATDESLILLRMVVGDLYNGDDWYIYQPGGDGGPLLTRLERPPGDRIFDATWVSLVSRPTSRRDDHDSGLNRPPTRGLSLLRPHRAPQEDDKFYMVAALCEDMSTIAKGRFILYLYNSKLRTWTTTNVSVEDQHFQKYQEEGYFLHINTNVIVIGGEDATVAFVDLWRGILLCDLSRVKDKPWLRYVPLPHREPAGALSLRDARLSRDIAIVDGQFKYIRRLLRRKPCPFSTHNITIGWTCDVFTRPVFASSLLDVNWEPVCSMNSSDMDIESSPYVQHLPRLEDDEGRPLPPFKGLKVSQPMLILDSDNTICFMIKNDGKAWVINVDMKNNRLQGVNEFDPTRYTAVDIAYKHSRISRYLKRTQGTKETLKRKVMLLLPGSSNKKVPW